MSTTLTVKLGQDEAALLYALVDDHPRWMTKSTLDEILGVPSDFGGLMPRNRRCRIALGNLVAIAVAEEDPARGWRATDDGIALMATAEVRA